MKRLGAILRRLRLERGMSTYQLAEAAGLHRSRITYLESGVPGEIGLEKSARLIVALDVSPDQVLREAGLLPAKSTSLAGRKALLAEHFGLTPRDAAEALTFLEFLNARAKTNKGLRPTQSRGQRKEKQQ
jgi:transcriptional regulator with XRE-family HTH domain